MTVLIHHLNDDRRRVVVAHFQVNGRVFYRRFRCNAISSIPAVVMDAVGYEQRTRQEHLGQEPKVKEAPVRPPRPAITKPEIITEGGREYVVCKYLTRTGRYRRVKHPVRQSGPDEAISRALRVAAIMSGRKPQPVHG